MELDQYLFNFSKPNPFNPIDRGSELAYWRRDWDLQNYINSDNGEYVNISLDYCNRLLDNLNDIYFDDDYFQKATYKAFIKARKILIAGGRITYYGNW